MYTYVEIYMKTFSPIKKKKKTDPPEM